MISIRKLISCGYILIFILIGMIIYCYQYEWKKLEVLEKENRTTLTFAVSIAIGTFF